MTSKETEPTKASFTIRGHHLILYQEVLFGIPTKSLADGDEMVLSAREKFGPGYVKDVIGTTPEEKNRFKTVEEKALKDFLSLPDDYPTEVITEKDLICAGCAVGKHCLDEKPRDEGFLAILLDTLNDTSQGEFSVQFDANRPKVPEKIATTLGLIRKTLRYGLVFIS